MNNIVLKQRKVKILLFIALTIIVLNIVGLFFMLHRIETNSDNLISDKWESGLTRYIFVWNINKVDKELGFLVREYVINFNKNKDNLINIPSNDLRNLRNMFFALHGYNFKDNELKKYFTRFKWYQPNDNTTPGIEELNNYEKNVVNTIIRTESEQKNVLSDKVDIEYPKKIIPENAGNYIIWNFKDFSPSDDLPVVINDYKGFSVKDSVDAVYNIIEEFGIRKDSVKTASIFRLPVNYSSEIFPFEIFIESSEIQPSKLLNELGSKEIIKNTGIFNYLIFDSNMIIGFINNGLLICSSSEAVNMISAAYEGKNDSYKFNDTPKKYDPALKIKIEYLDNLSIAVGPKSLGAKNIYVNLYRENNGFKAYIEGELTMTAIENSNKGQSYQKGYYYNDTYIPMIELWPEMILRSTKTKKYSYSVLSNNFTIEMVW